MDANSNAKPVFLAGYSKSGTTLLLSLLDGHPDLCVFPAESRFFSLAAPVLSKDPTAGVRFFVEHAFGDPLFGTQKQAQIPVDRHEYEAALESNWRARDFDIASFLPVAILTYGELSGQAGRRFWVEKTPHTELYAERIAEWFPDARMIYCVRDPRANYSAMKEWQGKKGMAFSIGRYAYQWRQSVRAAMRSESLLPTLTVRYEDLVVRAPETTGEIRRFLGIEDHPCLLRPTLGGKGYEGNSIYGRRFTGIDPSSLDQWRRVLSRTEELSICSILLQEMARFSYDPCDVSLGPGWFLEVLPSIIGMRAHELFNKLPDRARSIYHRSVGRFR